MIEKNNPILMGALQVLENGEDLENDEQEF